MRDTTYVGFHTGTWGRGRRTDADAVATLRLALNGYDWDIPSRRAPLGFTGNTLHPEILDRTVFEWFFSTIMFTRHVIGVDAAFGWPTGFRSFIDGVLPDPMPTNDDIIKNPILYREGERFIYELLDVLPKSVLDYADSTTKAQAVIGILKKRVGAHVAFTGRSESGRWCELDTIVVETSPQIAEYDPAFKRNRIELFADINRTLKAQGKPSLKNVEKAALSSALIAMGIDQAICNPGDGDSYYVVPSGMLPIGDRASGEGSDLFFAWKCNPSLFKGEGFASFPISRKVQEKVAKRKKVRAD
ncbi:MAG: hypothetical protein ACK47W_04495 [Bacteroidota bacterium]